MRITADTNIIVRAVVGDDPAQTAAAEKILESATQIVVSLPCLCEIAWVLRRVYSFDDTAIAATIQTLINTRNVVMNRPAAEAGLALLVAGGDFADGVLAYEGASLGAEVFVSFDRRAVKRLADLGFKTMMPGV